MSFLQHWGSNSTYAAGHKWSGIFGKIATTLSLTMSPLTKRSWFKMWSSLGGFGWRTWWLLMWVPLPNGRWIWRNISGIARWLLLKSMSKSVCYEQNTWGTTIASTASRSTIRTSHRHESKAKEGGEQTSISEGLRVISWLRECWRGRMLLAPKNHLVCYSYNSVMSKSFRLCPVIRINRNAVSTKALYKEIT